MAPSAAVPFPTRFAALRDPRQAAKVLCPLPEWLLLLLCGTVAGADDFVELTLWGAEHLAFLRRFLPFAHGIPSHDTLCEVVAALDPELFKTCFTNWVERLRLPGPDTIATDGKTSRRSHARFKGRGPLRTVSACTGQQLVLGQEAVSEKSNEITAILLLRRLEWAGAIVTIDAMGTQTQVAQTILDGGGDHVLALKQNRPATFTEVEALFAAPPRSLAIGVHRTLDGGHGRTEARRHAVCRDVGWLFSDRRYPGEPACPGLAMIGMVESRTERESKIEQERRCCLCSTRLDAETFARVVRSHRDIENRPHCRGYA